MEKEISETKRSFEDEIDEEHDEKRGDIGDQKLGSRKSPLRRSMRRLSSGEEDDHEDETGGPGIKDPHNPTTDQELKEEIEAAERMRNV